MVRKLPLDYSFNLEDDLAKAMHDLKPNSSPAELLRISDVAEKAGELGLAMDLRKQAGEF